MKKLLKEVPFDELYCYSQELKKDLFKVWADKHNIKHQTWILPQLLAFLAEHKPPKTENGLIDSDKYLKTNLDPNSAWDRGLQLFLMVDPRGLIVRDQYKESGRNYCALVPLVLAAHKMYNNVPYSNWSKKGLYKIVNKSLLDMMLETDYEDFSREYLIDIRNEGLLINSGKNAGEMRNPVSTHKLYKISSNPEFKKLPALTQVVLTQIWCAHPLNRTEYMILDPKNWDNIPEPLEDSQVLVDSQDSKMNLGAMEW